MALVQQSETTRLYPPTTLPGIKEGDWVDVLSVYTAGMRRQAIKRSMTVTLGSDNKPSTDIDTMAFRQCLLELIIKGWSDEAPLTQANIEQMHPDVQDWIAEEYDRIHTRDESEKKDSSEEPSPLSVLAGTSSPTNLGTS